MELFQIQSEYPQPILLVLFIPDVFKRKHKSSKLDFILLNILWSQLKTFDQHELLMQLLNVLQVILFGFNAVSQMKFNIHGCIEALEVHE